MVVNRSVNDDTRENRKDVSVVVDPLGKLEAGEVRKLDVSNPDDAWTRSAPVPKGFYDLRISPLGKDACKMVWEDPMDHSKGFSYSANVEFSVVSDDSELNGSLAYANFSTKIYRGKPLSTIAALIIKLGYSPFAKNSQTQEVSDGELLKKLAKIAAQSPIIKNVFLNWRIQYSTESGKWVTPLKDMDDFPENADGGKSHEVQVVRSDTKTREAMYASTYIQWDVKPEAKTTTKVTKVAVPAPDEEPVTPTKKRTAPAPIDDDDDLDKL